MTETVATPARNLRIQVASDLHVEFYGTPDRIPKDIIVPRAPVLALVGDIGLAFTENLRSFLHFQADRFDMVLFLAGNHEFYNHGRSTYTVSQQIEWMKSVCNERDNIYFLEKDALDIEGVRVLGTTLWSHIPTASISLAETSMNDYQLCYNSGKGDDLEKMTAIFTNQWHQESVQWLEEEIRQAKSRNQPVLVLTHHTPALKGTSHPRYNNNKLNSCFSTDLTHLMQSPVVAWVCGHTHYNFDTRHGTTRLVSNQRGYPGHEEPAYDEDGVVLDISSKMG